MIFLQICADFDRIWHKHSGLRPACEDRTNTRGTWNVRTKNLEKASRAKIVRERAKIRAKKNYEKTGRAKIVRKRNRATIRAKKTIVRTVRSFHPNTTLRRNFTKKIPNLPQNLHIQHSNRKSHGFAQKT